MSATITKPSTKSSAGPKRTPAKTSSRSVAKSIAAFSREFMLKPGERGIDAVGALLKSRGRA